MSAAASPSKPRPLSFVALGLAVLLALALLPRLAASPSPWANRPAPDFTLPVLFNGDAGARMRLGDLRGQVVVLDFWATWCGPCRLQAPVMDRVAHHWEGRGVVVLGIDVDDEADAAAAFARREGLSYPILSDSAKEASSAFRVERLPSLVIIDPEGRVRSYLSGVIEESVLDDLIASARDGA